MAAEAKYLLVVLRTEHYHGTASRPHPTGLLGLTLLID